MENKEIQENSDTLTLMEFNCKERHTKTVEGREIIYDTNTSLCIDPLKISKQGRSQRGQDSNSRRRYQIFRVWQQFSTIYDQENGDYSMNSWKYEECIPSTGEGSTQRKILHGVNMLECHFYKMLLREFPQNRTQVLPRVADWQGSSHGRPNKHDKTIAIQKVRNEQDT